MPLPKSQLEIYFLLENTHGEDALPCWFLLESPTQNLSY